jgi:hypothetical protein
MKKQVTNLFRKVLLCSYFFFRINNTWFRDRWSQNCSIDLIKIWIEEKIEIGEDIKEESDAFYF